MTWRGFIWIVAAAAVAACSTEVRSPAPLTVAIHQPHEALAAAPAPAATPEAHDAKPEAEGPDASAPMASLRPEERRPFAAYLVQMHNKVHPLFISVFDRDRDGGVVGPDPSAYAVVELVLAPSTGKIVKRGIVRASGSTAFDILALKTVDAAQPFGPAPAEIVSTDGLVYIRWEFHKNPIDACSTRGATPIVKRASP